MVDENKNTDDPKETKKSKKSSVKKSKTVVIKNVSSEYETITIDNEEQILYPSGKIEVISDNPDKLVKFLENKYKNSLTISIK